MVEEYFKECTNKYHEMQKALKRYVNAKDDFYHLTSINIDDMPKGNQKPRGLDDLLGNIEELNNEYLKRKEEYEVEKQKCKKDIDRLDNPIYRAIIEYSYINFETNKMIAESLKEYHNKDYSTGYIKLLKSKAIAKFKKIITKYNLI